MDESSKQLIEEARPSIPMEPGFDKRVDYEYVRHGVANIFMANEPLAGKRFSKITKNKTKKDWAHFSKWIADEKYSFAVYINLNIITKR